MSYVAPGDMVEQRLPALLAGAFTLSILWPFILHNCILHHDNSAPTQAGAALIALEIRHYETVFANQIFSPVKPHMRSR